jgi:DNA-binding NarL/FixJ family response regulator
MSIRVATDDITSETASDDAPEHSRWPFVDRRRADRRRSTTDRREYDRASAATESRRIQNSPSELRTATRLHPQDVLRLCTVREQQIVTLVLQAMTNKQIAQQLGIVEDTVKKHLQHVYTKLGVHRRTLIIVGRAAR